jgi:hypothetical protein
MTKGVIITNKKLRPLLIAALVFVLMATVASTALAKKPDNPGKPTTTTTTEPAVAQPCKTITTLSGSSQLQVQCDWTPERTAATTGIVQVTEISGEVSHVVMFVRDSDPGDICVLEQMNRPTGTVFIAGDRYDSNGEPLLVLVSVRVKKGTVVEVSLVPGQAP